jgi:hypothetical protein
LGPIGRNLGPVRACIARNVVLSAISSFRVCRLGQHLTGPLLRLFSSFIPSFRVYRKFVACVCVPRLLYPEYPSAAFRGQCAGWPQFLPLVLPPPRPPRPGFLPPPFVILFFVTSGESRGRAVSSSFVVFFCIASTRSSVSFFISAACCFATLLYPMSLSGEPVLEEGTKLPLCNAMGNGRACCEMRGTFVREHTREKNEVYLLASTSSCMSDLVESWPPTCSSLSGTSYLDPACFDHLPSIPLSRNCLSSSRKLIGVAIRQSGPLLYQKFIWLGSPVSGPLVICLNLTVSSCLALHLHHGIV